MRYVEIQFGQPVKSIGTRFLVEKGNTHYPSLTEISGRGPAISIRFEKQIVLLDGFYYRVGLDMFGGTAFVPVPDEELTSVDFIIEALQLRSSGSARNPAIGCSEGSG